MNSNHRICEFVVIFTCVLGAAAGAYNDPPVAIVTPNPNFWPLAGFSHGQDIGFGGGNSYDPDNGPPYGYDRGITWHDWFSWPSWVSGSVYYGNLIHQEMYCRYDSTGKKYVFLEVTDDDYPLGTSGWEQCDTWIFSMDLEMPNNPTGYLGVGDTTQLSLAYAPGNLYAGYKDLTVNAGGVIRVLQNGNPVISGQDKGQAWLLRSASDPSTLTVEGYSPGQVTLLLEYSVYGAGPYPGRPYNGDSVTVTVVEVDRLQYYDNESHQWVDVWSTLYVTKDDSVDFRAVPNPSGASWPSGKPIWGGSSGASGSGEEKLVTFSTLSSSPSDYKTVTAQCGNTVTANVVVYDFEGTLTPGDNFSGRSIMYYGIEEKVALDYTTDPWSVPGNCIGGLEWTKGNGSQPGTLSNVNVDYGTADYDAGETDGTVWLILTVKSGPSKGKWKGYQKDIVLPSGTRMTRTHPNTVAHTYGKASAGIELYYWLDPTNVSFKNLTFGEGSAPSTNVSGFFLTCSPWNSYPNGTQIGAHDQNTFGAILGGNATTGCRVEVYDRAFTGAADPYAAGSFTWSIPSQYIDDTATRHTFGAAVDHIATFQANGDATQSKGGQSGSAALNAPNSGF